MDEKYILEHEDPIDLYDGAGVCYERPLHFHDCLEMNLVTGGRGVNFIEDKKYPMAKGELYLLNNFEHHISMSDGTLQMKVLVFYPDFVWQNVPENYDYLVPFYSKTSDFHNKIVLNEDNYAFVVSCFDAIEKELKHKQTGWKLAVRAKLLELLAYIYRYLDSEKFLKTAMHTQISYERIRQSIDYIHKHFKETLSMEYLAELSCMSRTYFSSYFKNTMHMTVVEYVEQIRINYAQCEIAGSDKPVTDICFDCGYHNISSFNVAFKKHCGMSPSAYRKQMKRKEV